MRNPHSLEEKAEINRLLDNIKKDKILLKGEIVLVIEGSEKKHSDYILNPKIRKDFLKKLSPSEAAKLISIVTGKNKREIYKYLIET